MIVLPEPGQWVLDKYAKKESYILISCVRYYNLPRFPGDRIFVYGYEWINGEYSGVIASRCMGAGDIYIIQDEAELAFLAFLQMSVDGVNFLIEKKNSDIRPSSSYTAYSRRR